MRLTWLYLRQQPVPAALDRLSRGLRRFAAAAGRPERYHETITWACLFLIHERMEHHGGTNWNDFAAANPDLLDWETTRSLLSLYYRVETLDSERARRRFLLPDRLLPIA